MNEKTKTNSRIITRRSRCLGYSASSHPVQTPGGLIVPAPDSPSAIGMSPREVTEMHYHYSKIFRGCCWAWTVFVKIEGTYVPMHTWDDNPIRAIEALLGGYDNELSAYTADELRAARREYNESPQGREEAAWQAEWQAEQEAKQEAALAEWQAERRGKKLTAYSPPTAFFVYPTDLL